MRRSALLAHVLIGCAALAKAAPAFAQDETPGGDKPNRKQRRAENSRKIKPPKPRGPHD